MNEAIERLLERMQTGWAPKADEIDAAVLQVDALDWEWSHDGRAILSRTVDRRPQIHDDVLHVDRHLAYALTSEFMLWLYDAEESDKIRFLGG